MHQYIEQFGIVRSIFKKSAPTIQRKCPPMLHTHRTAHTMHPDTSHVFIHAYYSGVDALFKLHSGLHLQPWPGKRPQLPQPKHFFKQFDFV